MLAYKMFSKLLNLQVWSILCIALICVKGKHVSKSTPNLNMKNPGQITPAIERRDNIDERGPYNGGDMIIPEEMFIQSKAGILGNRYRWAEGKIPCVLDSSFVPFERDVVLSAFREIQSKTCIRFMNRTTEPDYVNIVRGSAGSGCWSLIGKQGGKQTVNIQPGNPGCIHMGIVAHELIHAIGYFHEQSRTDRDNYVKVHWPNIKQGFEGNFNMYNLNKIDPNGVGYDFNSIMHYSAYAFSKNGELTLEPIAPGATRSSIGQRRALSAMDALKINNMYTNECQ